MTGAESVLAHRGMRRPDIEDLLRPAWALEGDALAWEYMSDGLAMFLSPGNEQTYRVPIPLPAIVTVGDRFMVGPLMRTLTGDERFLLLALSQRRMRLLEGSRDRVQEVELSDVPTSLRDVVAPPEPRSDTMAHPTSGRGGPAVFYGYGAADDQFKTDEIERYLRRFAEGLDEYLTGQELPMVLVGLDLLVATYRRVSDYPGLLPDPVVRNPDELTAEELHAAAWPLLAERLREDREHELERFRELHGTGRASADPEKVAEAAAQGRVELLLLASDPSCWDAAATDSAVRELGRDDDFARCELVDRASVDTLAHGGRVLTLPGLDVPDKEHAAAIFRY